MQQEETGINRSVSGNDITIHEDEQELPEFEWLLEGNLTQYSDVAPEKRPNLLRLRICKNMEGLVRFSNKIIPKYIPTRPSLTEMDDVIHASAATVCKLHGSEEKPFLERG
ncbi:hypothetical protein HHI36_017222 [Cryptolaemus montrouzieri]|uniref:Uncharacterized protein n=1 Tax=Cryptolaemus montrouzieri TaxID=559131 RepID=A0ABD2NM54_9CUCU